MKSNHYTPYKWQCTNSSIHAFKPTPSHIHLELATLGAIKEGQRYPQNFMVDIVKLIKTTEKTLFSIRKDYAF